METACQHYPAGIVPVESDILAFGSNTALADGTAVAQKTVSESVHCLHLTLNSYI